MALRRRTNNIINGIDTVALKKTVADIQDNPSLAHCEFRVSNHWLTGDDNESVTHDFYAAGAEQKHKKNFHFHAGEPAILEGQDKGANPVEYLLSSLSGCMTTTIAYYAALNGYKIQQMDSEYEGELDLQGLLNLDSTVRPGYQQIHVYFKIKTNAPKKEIEKYYHFSPVYDVISRSVPIEVTIETFK